MSYSQVVSPGGGGTTGAVGAVAGVTLAGVHVCVALAGTDRYSARERFTMPAPSPGSVPFRSEALAFRMAFT